MRIAIPTRDRPDSLAICLTALGQSVRPKDEVFLYDDGEVQATRSSTVRFGLDLCLFRGAHVTVKRESASPGIHLARARMLDQALSDGVNMLVMLDDDVIVPPFIWSDIEDDFEVEKTAQYIVPAIAIVNNEAGVQGYGHWSDDAPHQQWVLSETGLELMRGGAWTCAIGLAMDRFDVRAAVMRLQTGPPVVEDFVLTKSMTGFVNQRMKVYHAMTPDQGSRGWEGRDLAYLRRSLA